MRRLLIASLTSAVLVFSPSAGALAAPIAGHTPQTTTAAPAPASTVTSTVIVDLDGRSFEARLVQPGPGTRSVAGPYPVVAFGHGMLQKASRYDSTLRAIAARGYIVIAPDSEMSPLASQSDLADDLWRAILWVRAHIPDAHPTLDAVVGHSLGGGAALIAADRHPSLETVAALAPAQLTPDAAISPRGIDEPALYVAGDLDRLVPAPAVLAQYLLASGPAMFASIVGGYHCGFNDTVALLGLGCDIGAISRARQLSITRAVLTGWLDQQFRGRLWTLPGGVHALTR